jgi:hypothetical protein
MGRSPHLLIPRYRVQRRQAEVRIAVACGVVSRRLGRSSRRGGHSAGVGWRCWEGMRRYPREIWLVWRLRGDEWMSREEVRPWVGFCTSRVNSGQSPLEPC